MILKLENIREIKMQNHIHNANLSSSLLAGEVVSCDNDMRMDWRDMSIWSLCV